MEPRKSTRNLYNSSRRQENSTLDLVDRISALPDAILGVILSYLPTKNAVATAILSKRWKFAWMTVSNLDFCYDHDCTHEDGEDVKFVRFVNRVLLIPDGGLLNKLLLVWQTSFIPSQASLWINTAITRNVHELLLFVGSPSDPWDLPLNLLSCETLQCLQLNGCISISAAVVVSLPRLETLTLVSVCYESEETFRKLISGGCPMLNDLYVEDLDVDGFTKHYGEDDVFKYRISSPFLRRLELCDNQWDFEIPRTLELEASSLEYLDLTGPINQVFVQGSLSSLVEASLMVNLTEYNEDSYNSLAKGVGSFHCAKALDLSHDVMWALGNATISLSTKFRRLTRLTAHVVCCYCSTLQDFIQSSDNLKVLTIYKQTYDLARFDHDHSNWTAPVEVSKCLSNSLKVVSFDCYSGCDDEREMIGYMLKHGSALEVMQITCDEVNSKGKKLELIKEKCRFPRRSPNCIVEFISKHDASPHSQ